MKGLVTVYYQDELMLQNKKKVHGVELDLILFLLPRQSQKSSRWRRFCVFRPGEVCELCCFMSHSLWVKVMPIGGVVSGWGSTPWTFSSALTHNPFLFASLSRYACNQPSLTIRNLHHYGNKCVMSESQCVSSRTLQTCTRYWACSYRLRLELITSES